MLQQMRIQNLGVIDDAVLELSPGLNVLTGETGAGKTMVVSGLSLLLGGRADAGLVRAGVDHASVEGIVTVAPDHPARARVDEAGGDASDDLILARTVSAQGRSRAHVGGRAAPVAVLSELGELLVAVHGQADQWRLRRPEAHRQMLDDFGGPSLRVVKDAYGAAYEHVVSLSRELERVRGLERDRAVESDVLRHGLEEIERVDPQPDEDLSLREEDERLANADSLREAAGQAQAALSGSEDFATDGAACVTDLLAGASAELRGAAQHDPALGELARRVDELGYLAADVATDLGAYLTGVDADPARLSWVQSRRAELSKLQRAYGDTVTDVLAWGARAAARLAELDGAFDRAHEIAQEFDEARERLAHAAADLTAARRQAAGELASRVTAELGHLAMGRAELDVAVEQRPADDGLTVPGHPTPVRYGPHGADDVDIRLAANPGAPARSVTKAASGGELSRVMLALEVVTSGPDDAKTSPRPHRAGRRGADQPLAPPSVPGARPGDEIAKRTPGQRTPTPTFVFDEVDAGVGGKAATDIGARLAALAEHAQVVVVTHLAQVAAFADRHLVVHKADDGQVTSSGVRAVEGDARLRELARMMAGADTDLALEHAAELRAQAQHRRRNASAT